MRYTITERIGEGRFTEVFRGTAESVHGYRGRVCVKRAKPGWESHAGLAAAFEAAGRAAWPLQHENIVQVYDVGYDGDVACMVTGDVHGTSLEQLLAGVDGSRLAPELAVHIALFCCRALDYAHTGEERVTHGEVTPSNILLSRHGEVLLADFGLAQAINAACEARDPEQFPVMWLDPRYQSPEWALTGEVTPQSDVFSVGLVLWRMLAGERLHETDGDASATARIARHRTPALSAVGAEVDATLEAIVARALERVPAARYASARELGDALMACTPRVQARELARLVREHAGAAEAMEPRDLAFRSVLPGADAAAVPRGPHSERRESSILFSLRELHHIEADRVGEAEREAREAEEARVRAEVEARRRQEERERELRAREEETRLYEAEVRARAEHQARVEQERLHHELELRRMEVPKEPGLLGRMFGWLKRRAPEPVGHVPPPDAEPTESGAGRDVLADADPVECSVHAPPRAAVGETILVQVFAHLDEHAAHVATLARAADPDAELRATRSLPVDVPRGTRLGFELSFPGTAIDTAFEQITWRGKASPVQFDVCVPADAAGKLVGKVVVSQDGVPVGAIRFAIVVDSAAVHAEPEATGTASRYRYAFISYAAEDRAEVMRRVQMLETLRIEFFQDVLALDPGARWEGELYRNIDRADVFFLFWSRAASNSDWVRREIEYAVQRKAGADDNPPEILPVVIGGECVPPPEQLSHLHFGSLTAYFTR